MQKRVCIVGGGLLGMTLAHRLSRSGCHVTLYEAASSLGGLASVWKLGEIEWDRHYHVLLASDLALRDLLRDLDLEDRITWAQTKTGFFIDGNLRSFTGFADFAAFPGLGLYDKARLLLTIAANSRERDVSALESESVSVYLRRWSGARVFQRFWGPLLRSKLGDSYEDASAFFIWATIRRLTAARRAGLKEKFGYVSGGYKSILTAFESVLRQQGVCICLNTPVSRIRVSQSRLEVSGNINNAAAFDQVIVTTPAPVAVAQCEDLTPDEKSRWLDIRYKGIICASVLSRQPLAAYYITNIADSTLPFTAVIEMSTIVSPSDLQNRSLVYLPKYLDPDDPMFEWSDAQVKQLFFEGLRRMYPHFSDQDVEAFEVSRARHVFAIPTLHHTQKIPGMKTSVPGLYILNSAQINTGTLNVNETVELANAACSELAA